MLTNEKYPCPVCGRLVHDQKPGSHGVCPVCGWEDDLAQLRFPLMTGSTNRVSLQVAQENYAELGASEKIKQGKTRRPFYFESLDQGWRPVDEVRDNIELPRRGEDYSLSYPWADTTVLYYWRRTYWRRASTVKLVK